MFFTNKINISSQDESRALIPIYQNINAQIYKKNVKLNNDISENTVRELTYILIKKNYTDISEGNIIEYKDDFGKYKKLKILGMNMIKSLHFTKLIELKCDLI